LSVLLCALFFLFTLLLLLTPVTLQINYRHGSRDDRKELLLGLPTGRQCRLFRPVVNATRLFYRPLPKLRPPSAKAGGKKERPYAWHRIKRWYRLAGGLWPAARYLLRHTRPSCIKWRTLIGLPDAAATGMAVGVLWSLKGAALTAMRRLLGPVPVPPEIAVVPCFTSCVFAVELQCAFTTRAVYIFIALWRAAILFLSGKINGRFKV